MSAVPVHVQKKSLAQTAQAYAAKGIPVFPCRPDKKPYVSQGFKAASTDTQQIDAYWRKWPDAMIGVPTGAASGFWVLDIDAPKEPGDTSGFDGLRTLITKHGELPRTRCQATPSGGQHYFFRLPKDGRTIRNSAGKVAPKIDVRGDGGYIIIAPSMGEKGAYVFSDESPVADAPEWLLELVAPTVHASPPQQHFDRPRQQHDSNHPYVQAALDSELGELAAAPSGMRNDRLNRAAFALGQWLGGGYIGEGEARAMLLEAADRCGVLRDDGESQTLKTIDGGLAKGRQSPREVPKNAVKRSASDPERKREGGGSNPAITEESIASSFAAEHKDTLRFCGETGHWFEWCADKKVWQKDRTRRVFHYVREECRRLNLDGKATLGRASTAIGVEKFACSDPRLATVSEQWDRHSMVMGTPAGPVSLNGENITETARDLLITKSTSVAPIAGPAPVWLAFLEEATKGDKELQRFLQQICGYCLTGDTRFHALFFIYGPGGNGKSVFLNTLNRILGDYAVTAAMDTFTASKADRHSTDLAMLRGARLVSVSETEEGRAWKESLIKALTGGDPITARFMRQDNFTFLPQFKLVIVSNHKPRLRGVDDAMRRRINIIPFVHKPENPDPFLEDKLRTEYPQILHWMIEGCADWQQHGLIRPAVVQEATQDYFETQDLFGSWLEENCEQARNKSDSSSGLYADWKAYAERAGENAGSQVRFADNMDKRGFQRRRTMQGRVYDGIALKPNEQNDWKPYAD